MQLILPKDELNTIYERAHEIEANKTGLRIMCLSLRGGDPVASRELYDYALDQAERKEGSGQPIERTTTDVRLQCLALAGGEISMAEKLFTFVTGGAK